MRIEKTDILDLTEETIDKHKVDLANNILNIISPKLNEDYQAVISRKENLIRERKEIKKKNIDNKYILESLFEEHKKKKKQYEIIMLVEEIGKKDIINSLEVKKEIKILLKVMRDLSLNSLNEHITNLKQILRKRS